MKASLLTPAAAARSPVLVTANYKMSFDRLRGAVVTLAGDSSARLPILEGDDTGLEILQEERL